MSMWQLMSAIAGYAKANGSGGNKLSESQKDYLFERLNVTGDGRRKVSTQTYEWSGAWPEPKGVVSFWVG